jgi:WD40 repeat protein
MGIDHRHLTVALLTAIAGCDAPVRIQPSASLKAHGHVTSVAISPDGAHLATAGGRRESPFTPYSADIALWDAALQRELRRIRVSGQIQDVEFSPDGKTLAVADGSYSDVGHVNLFDVSSGERVKTIEATTGWIHDLEFSPDGKLLVTCGSTFVSKAGGQGSEEGKITVWEVSSWRESSSHEWPRGTFRCVAFSPDGRSYITGGGTSFTTRPDSGEVRLWDATTGQSLWHREGLTRVVECLAFAPGGKLVASGGMDGFLRLWDAADGKELAAIKLGEECDGRVLSIAFSPDGKHLAAAIGEYNRSGSCGELRLLKVEPIQARTYLLLDLPSPFTCVGFSPDGNWLAAGAAEGTVRLWEAAKVVADLSAHEGPH